MKIKDILLTANANLFRSKLRTFLTILAIFIGAFTLTLTTGMGSGISSYVDTQVSNLGASNALMLTVKDTSSTGIGSSAPKKYDAGKVTGAATRPGISGLNVTLMTDSDIATLKANPQLHNVVPVLAISPAYIQGASADKYKVSHAQGAVNGKLDLAAGVNLVSDSSQYQLILPVDFVSVLGYSSNENAVGKTVTIGIADANDQIHQVSATIVGVQNKGLTGSASITTNYALSNALYAQQSIGVTAVKKDQYASATATYDTNLTSTQITDLKNSLSNQGYTMTTLADALGTFQTVVSSIVYILDAFAVIALLAASFGIINTLLMSVQERTKEIGLMKAMGMRRSRIFMLFSIEAILIGLWGSLFGVVIAEGVGVVANHIAATTLLKDLPGFTLLAFPAVNVITIMVLIMLVAFLAGALPARKAAKQNPIDALRYE